MFTGIVEETGEVVALRLNERGAELSIRASTIRAAPGHSLAVNGCCLTVSRIEGGILGFDLLGETLGRTNLGQLKLGSRVNLERPLPADGRIDGHFVQGHVDGTAEVMACDKTGNETRLEVALPREFARYVALKGSIAMNGVSLTVAELRDESFAVWIIPHTLKLTNLSDLQPGGRVNLEFDLLAKYLERMLAAR